MLNIAYRKYAKYKLNIAKYMLNIANDSVESEMLVALLFTSFQQGTMDMTLTD